MTWDKMPDLAKQAIQIREYRLAGFPLGRGDVSASMWALLARVEGMAEALKSGPKLF
jgi:hypothetical protein